MGQHEGAFHTVGAAKFGNIYQTEVAAYSGLMMHWEGIQEIPSLTADLAAKSTPAVTTPLPLLSVMSTPIVATYPSFSIGASPTVAVSRAATSTRRKRGGAKSRARSSRSTKGGLLKKPTTITYVRKAKGGWRKTGSS